MLVVMKLDSSGTVLWSKALGSATSDDGYGVTQIGDTLFVTGRNYNNASSNSRYYNGPALYKLWASTGMVFDSAHFDFQFWRYLDGTDIRSL